MAPKLKIVVKDYRIIKEASVDIQPGITLISARNCNGKSTLLKALKTVLDGEFGDESNFRHGTEQYAIALRYGDDKVIVRRVGKETFIKNNDEPERTKLGRGALNKLVPSFPIQRVDYQDSSFYPNIASQNSVPIFGDISVFDLFSSMFSSIARLAHRQDELRKEGINLNKKCSDLESLIDYSKSTSITLKQDYEQFKENNPDIDEQYSKLECLTGLNSSLLGVQQQLNSIPEVNTAEVEKNLSLYEQAEPLFKAFDYVNAVKGSYNNLQSMRAKLSELPEPHTTVSTDLVALASRLNDLRSNIPVVDQSVDIRLVELSTALVSNKNNLSVLEQEIVQLEQSIAQVKEELSKTECPYKIEGVCPYAK